MLRIFRLAGSKEFTDIKMKASHYMPEHGKTDRFRIGTVEKKYLPSGDMVS